MRFILVTAVIILIFLNGATDASNAIASAVTGGALKMRQAALLAAVCNTAGGLAGGIFFAGIAEAVTDSADFGPYGEIGVLASIGAAVLFTFAAWLLRLPTSESHALLAATAGASMLLSGGGHFARRLLPSVLWMSLCGLSGFLAGLLAGRIFPRSLSPRTVRRMQILCAAAASFLHGVQDLAKFMALLYASGAAAHPLLLPAAAGIMGLGTLCGGQRMTEAVGEELASLDAPGALAADLASAATLGLLSAMGIPASTTHARTAAAAGSALSGRFCTLHRPQLLRFIAAWILTFPLCAALGALLAQLMTTFF